MKHIALLLTLALSTLAWTQDGASGATKLDPSTQEANRFSVAAKGTDVRGVLYDLFTQSKKSFVLEPNVRTVLYLSLTDVPFDEALEIICHTAGLKYEINGAIYYVSVERKAEPVKPKPEVQPKPLGKIADKELLAKIETRFSMTDIRKVFEEFQSQTGIVIEVDKKVPAYKIDAFLVSTSLKYSLDVVTKAAGLVWVKTDNRTIQIQVKAKA